MEQPDLSSLMEKPGLVILMEHPDLSLLMEQIDLGFQMDQPGLDLLFATLAASYTEKSFSDSYSNCSCVIFSFLP